MLLRNLWAFLAPRKTEIQIVEWLSVKDISSSESYVILLWSLNNSAGISVNLFTLSLSWISTNYLRQNLDLFWVNIKLGFRWIMLWANSLQTLKSKLLKISFFVIFTLFFFLFFSSAYSFCSLCSVIPSLPFSFPLFPSFLPSYYWYIVAWPHIECSNSIELNKILGRLFSGALKVSANPDMHFIFCDP